MLIPKMRLVGRVHTRKVRFSSFRPTEKTTSCRQIGELKPVENKDILWSKDKIQKKIKQNFSYHGYIIVD